jgi:Uma2 family endonuclease
MAVVKTPTQRSKRTPTVADLFPAQGEWSEEEYLALDTNRIVELSDGKLEIQEMPTHFHQLIVVRLITLLYPFVLARKLGYVLVAPLRVRLWPGKFREPDLVFMAADHAQRIHDEYWEVPDLVAEVISESNPNLDRVRKKEEYARAGIPEYWLVDPYEKRVEVYRLEGETYQVHAELEVGDELTSPQLPGFALSLAELFAETS